MSAVWIKKERRRFPPISEAFVREDHDAGRLPETMLKREREREREQAEKCRYIVTALGYS